MRPLRTVFVILISAALGAVIAAQGKRGGTRIAAGQECPPGTTEVRPGICMAPSEPPPSILDYRPRTTLVTAEHKVPKAKFPVIDVHSHQGQLTAESMKRLVETMDPLNLRVLTLADNISGERLVQTMAVINASPYKDRFRALAGIDEDARVQLRFYPQVESPFEALGSLFGASSESVEALVRLHAVLSDPRFARAMAAIREEDASVRAESEAPTIR